MGILRRIGSAAVGAEAEAAFGCGCWDVVVVVVVAWRRKGDWRLGVELPPLDSPPTTLLLLLPISPPVSTGAAADDGDGECFPPFGGDGEWGVTTRDECELTGVGLFGVTDFLTTPLLVLLLSPPLSPPAIMLETSSS